MTPFCNESQFQFVLGLHYSPFFYGALLLFAFGAIHLAFHFLRGKWKALPLVALCAVLWFISHDFIAHEYKLAAAQGLWEDGVVTDDQSAYSTRDLSEIFTAQPVLLGSDCSRGFIVTTDGSHLNDFVSMFDRSPLPEMIDQDYDGYRKCMAQNMIMHDIDNATDQCIAHVQTPQFFLEGEHDYGGFQMKWCRRLDRDAAYCEAESISVASANGTQW